MAKENAKNNSEEKVEQEVNNTEEKVAVENEDKKEESADSKDEKKESKSSKKSKKNKAEEKLNELEDALAKKDDQILRLQAEFDNYRRRTLKEKMELTKSAGESILVNILPVIDDFERAIQAMEEHKELEAEAVKEGVVLIYKRFNSFLEQNGVKEIEAKEKELDTDYHEAITKIPAPTEELKGKVVDVIQKGYTLNEKVIRFAKVVIGE